MVVIRHPASGTPQLLAERDWIDAPVLNAGDGMHEHPTQALLDAYTLRERIHGGGARGRDLDGVHVVIVGDILHSRYGVMERPLSEVLAEQQRKALEEPERAASWRYAREIISGYLEHEHDIDTRIEATATGWTLERMPSVDAAILRIGTWEILYNDEVPTEVAISEAIVAASEYSTDDSSRFVSGVLGAIADAVGSVGKQ